MTGLVILAPHPDDESLGCGGLISAARAARIDVRIVIISDGTGSHPHSRRYPPERLRALRESEAVEAAAALGVAADAVEFLRLPDRFVTSTGPEADDAITAISAMSAACNASHMAVTWSNDPHCDHQAASELAVSVRRLHPDLCLLAYPIWGLALPPEDPLDVEPPRGFRFDIGDYLPAKRAAIAAHRSQVTGLIDDDPQGFMLSPKELARFDRPFEIYLDVRP